MTAPPESEALAPTLAATPRTRDSSPGIVEAAGDALPAGEILGERYRIVELVGQGGQGAVYRAEDQEVPGHVVALKLMHGGARSEEERAFATRELRMLAAVSHPAIVQFKDSGWYGARLWFVMPWLEGKNLEQAGRITRAEARRIFENVAAGVAALHAKGMRHQDIKPSNIFLARIDGFEDALPMLLDLGVAATDDDAPIAGSPDYFAPEVFAAAWPVGDVEMGPEADVYALALTIRNALDPDTAPTVDAFSRASLDARAGTPVAPPSGRDLAYLRGTFERWLSIDPARRPTAEALLAELAILTQPEDQRRERVRTFKRLAPWAVLLTIGLIAGGVWVDRELQVRAKAAAIAADERRVAELAALSADERADAAQQAERAAIQRATSSADEAAQRELEAQAAMARVRSAQAALGRVQGDRARLSEALAELQAALTAAERTRAEEQRARAELERSLRAASDQFDQERRALTEARDRAIGSGAEAEARARALDARATELAAAVAAADGVAAQAEARAGQAEARAGQAEARAGQAEARAAELERRVAELERRLAEPSPLPRPAPAPADVVPAPQPELAAPIAVPSGPALPSAEPPSVQVLGETTPVAPVQRGRRRPR